MKVQWMFAMAVVFTLGLWIGATQPAEGQASTTSAARSFADTQTQHPPQFPRPGAEKVFENDKIIVWDQVELSTEAYMHVHVRDEFEILMTDGPTRSIDVEGNGRDREHVGSGVPGVIGYFQAGLGPHSLQATDPNNKPRVIYIEFKGTEPEDCNVWATTCE